MERDTLSRLDSASSLASADPGGALNALSSIPDQVRDAATEAHAVSRLPAADGIAHVLVCGMGGSGVGGDLLAVGARHAGSVPIGVHRTYGAPAFCGPDTFVIASSYSGETEETLDAFRAARAAGARGLAVTAGGSLAAEAADAGWAVIRPPAGLMPRYALGWMTAAPGAVLERMGLLRLAAGWRGRLPDALERRVGVWGPDAPADANIAKGLAHALDRSTPVIWGSDGASSVAAVRWKNDIAENAKVLGHAAVLPELDHNEIVGLAAEGSDGRTSERRVLVCLREPQEDPRISERFVHTVREVTQAFDQVCEFTASGEDPMERFFDLALLGGFVSVYMAVLRGVDPVPIEAIARLKAALA